MRPTGQQFGGGFAAALGFFAACKGLMVEKEAQQIQISRPDLATQEERVAQSAVEILDQGAGAVEAVKALLERVLERGKKRCWSCRCKAAAWLQ
jgi:hypothetical protein